MYSETEFSLITDIFKGKHIMNFSSYCLLGKGMIRVRSQHNNWFEDRQFDFDCEGNSRITHYCKWTDYVNSMRGSMNYACPHNYVITGVESYHQNGKEDRRFKFECCKVNGKVDHCSNSGYVNNYDHQLNFGSSDKFMTGWKSTFSGWHKDRKFSFDVCEIGHGSAIGK